jgi:hypothetical protein
MSIRMGLAVAAGLFAAFALVGNAGAEMAAPKKAAPPKPQRFAGACVSKGTPEFCTILTIRAKAYNVSSANPALPVGKRVTGWGNVTSPISVCGAPVLEVKTWKAVGSCLTAKKK